ncbi:MAG: HD domain-containing phosphohydrolase [Methylobacter sp.]
MSEFLYILFTTDFILLFIGFFIFIELLLPYDSFRKGKQQIRNIAFVLLGIAALTFHLDIGNDVIIDLRGTAIAIANTFGGYWVGAATALVESVYRWHIGGPSAVAGLIGIASDFMFSAICVYFSQKGNPANRIRLRTIVLTGIAVGISEALSLIWVPEAGDAAPMLVKVGIDLFLAQLIATVLVGGLLKLLDDRLYALAESDQKSKRLDKLFKQSIGALSAAMMYRDPTTAGHEMKVADLATAVGRELGLDSDRLEGLYVAALVHDFGQIQVPTEIFARSRRLSREEFELIKEHCRSGYEILHDIEFPWPVAEIVYQHHENVDGTGYPRALKDRQIFLEAKIIHVCDSFEAMLSHRPFRRAYDMNYALAQIQELSGSHYAPEVVDACVRLVLDKGYAFPGIGK